MHKISPAAALGMALALAVTLAGPRPASAEEAKGNTTRIIDDLGAPRPRTLDVPAAGKPHRLRLRPAARLHRHRYAAPLYRPALAGVVLAEPVPGPFKAPRKAVFAPAYLFDSIAADLTTPPPPLVCERRSGPVPHDPQLYREVPVACRYDID